MTSTPLAPFALFAALLACPACVGTYNPDTSGEDFSWCQGRSAVWDSPAGRVRIAWAQAQDPFAPSPQLQRALDAEQGNERGSGDFRVLDEAPALPEMHLRGVVKLEGRAVAAAVIELDGLGHYVVREGESLSFTLQWTRVVPTSAPVADGAPPPAPVLRKESIPIALKVQRIGRDSVQVQVGTLGEVLVIR